MSRPRAKQSLPIAPLVEADGPQPAAKVLPDRVIVELAHLVEEDDEHVLDEIHRVVRLQLGTPSPGEQERRVEFDEPTPGDLVIRFAKFLQQGEGGGKHLGWQPKGSHELPLRGQPEPSPYHPQAGAQTREWSS